MNVGLNKRTRDAQASNDEVDDEVEPRPFYLWCNKSCAYSVNENIANLVQMW